jgi:hypothetical protein
MKKALVSLIHDFPPLISIQQHKLLFPSTQNVRNNMETAHIIISQCKQHFEQLYRNVNRKAHLPSLQGPCESANDIATPPNARVRLTTQKQTTINLGFWQCFAFSLININLSQIENL